MFSRVGFFRFRRCGEATATRSEGELGVKTQLSGSHRRTYDGERLAGSIVLDATHLTEDQLPARARDFYAEIT
jgi:hypothetical protein